MYWLRGLRALLGMACSLAYSKGSISDQWENRLFNKTGYPSEKKIDSNHHAKKGIPKI